MTETLLNTTKHTACPAYDYCRAIESYETFLPNNNACYLEESNSAWHICPEYKEGTARKNKSEDASNSGDKDGDGRAGKSKDASESFCTSNREFNRTYQQNLVQQLFALAIQTRTQFDRAGQQSTEVEVLIESFAALFFTRLALWKAMIGATRIGREFTDVELDHYQQAIAEAQASLDDRLAKTDRVVALRALCAHDHELKKRYALQFDPPMIEDINSLIGNIINTRPTLIVGDKGIAKTQVAKFVMSLYDSDPIVISVKGDMMSDELIGKIKHDRLNNTFVFQEGMLLVAMRKGLPILLDEINFGDQAIIARLQDILLRRPGETVFIQESGNEPLVIKPGFAVIATANEASQRYRHREILDPAIRDRFSIITRAYPDITGNPLTDIPSRLLRLSLSSAVNRWGLPSRHIDLHMLENFVRLVHATEYLYSVPARDVVLDIETDSLTSSVIEENQPLMTDCVTPRTLSKLIADCSRGNIPGARLNIELVLRTIQSLDQAGSTHNLTLAHQVRMLLDIGTDGIVPSITEGGVAVTEFIDLDDEGSVELDDLELTKAITPSNSGSTDSTDSTGDSGSAGDSNSAGDSGSTNSAGDSGSAKIFLGLSQRAIKAIFADRLY